MLPTILNGLLNLLYPLNCLICDRALEIKNTRHLCKDCWSKIELVEEREYLPSRGRKDSYAAALSVGFYDGILKECVHLLKYRGIDLLARPLAELMLEVIEGEDEFRKVDVIVPVPLHRRKKRERGYNQALLLAREIARRIEVKVSRCNLYCNRQTLSQTKLKDQERLKNVKGAFSVKIPDEFQGKSILLVDDVFTTGATAGECSRILKKTGAKNIHVMTVVKAR